MRNTIAFAAVVMLAAPWAVTHAQQDRELRAEARVERGARERGEPREARDRLSGTFELAVSTERAQQQINRAIDEAIAEMSWFRRGFARSRLREKNPVRETLRTEVSGDRVTIEYGGEAFTTRDGRWQTVTATGEELRLLQQVVGDRIYQTFRSEDGEKTTVYSPSDDGDRMTLDVIVTSPQLPRPLRYELIYRRTGGGAVATR